MAIIPCRFEDYDEVDDEGYPLYYVDVPHVWLGEHAVTAEQARKTALDAGLSGHELTFAISVMLLDDYRLPGMDSKKWDFSKLPLRVIAWVNALGYLSYQASFAIEKKHYEPLQIG